MKTKEFARYLSQLEKTASRNQITAILAELFKKTSSQEINKVTYLVLGRLAPSFTGIEFNIAEKMMVRIIALSFNSPEKLIWDDYKKRGDLGETAVAIRKAQGKKFPSHPLSLTTLYRRLWQIAQEGGEGSQERKNRAMAQLIRDVDPSFLKYLVRIPIGKLRLGFSDATILDALSWMKKKDKSLRPEIEAAYNICADIGKIAKTFKKEGIRGLKKIKSQPGIPIRAARAERLPSAQKIIEKLGPCAVEPKIDGFRVQIHINEKPPTLSSSQTSLLSSSQPLVKIFSRNLEDMTPMFPEIVRAGRRLVKKNKSLKSCILDGEAVGYDAKRGKFFPFQETVQRKRKYGIKEARKKIPLVVFVFDLLFYNGRHLLQRPFRQRREILAKIIPQKKGETLYLTPQKILRRPEKIRKTFEEAIAAGLEGVMCKKLDSPYQAGARNFNWVKYKRGMEDKLLDTVDCLVIGYYRGRGKRASFGIGAFLVGVYEPKSDSFTTIAKIGTGLSDEQWGEMKKRCDQVKTKEKPKQYRVDKNLFPDVWCQPAIVVEIKADEITRSPIHTAGKGPSSQGLALRFPRLVRFRAKSPQQVTTVKELIELYQNQ